MRDKENSDYAMYTLNEGCKGGPRFAMRGRGRHTR